MAVLDTSVLSDSVRMIMCMIWRCSDTSVLLSNSVRMIISRSMRHMGQAVLLYVHIKV